MKYACINPWISIEADAIGRAKPCCIYQGQIGNFQNDSIADLWNNDKITSLRNEFILGNRPKECSQCWQTEDAGGESKRLKDNYKFRKLLSRWHSSPNNVPYPSYYDLKLGTVCNLKCRTCSTASSHKWAEDEIEIYGHVLQEDTTTYWIDDNSPIWNEISNNLDTIVHFDFSGGEPFLIKRHVVLLKECVKKGVAKNISIHYNTNGTITPTSEMTNLWQEFKEVNVMISMDSTHDRFNYMRHPANWNIVEANYLNLSKLNYIHTSICYTVSIFTLYYIPEFLHYIKSQEIDESFVYFNLMVFPTYLSIQNIPPKAYSAFVKKLGSYPQCENFLNIMQANYVNEQEWFLEKTEQIDVLRKENWKETFKELHKIL